MSDQAKVKINEAIKKLKFTPLKGIYRGFVNVTPAIVKKPPKKRNSNTYAKFKFDAKDNAKNLDTQEWKNDNGSILHLHIYEGGLKFPESCPVSLSPTTHYELLETIVQRRHIGKVRLAGEDPQKTFEALSCDRYWYAIPFSDKHGIEDGALDMLGSDMSTKFRIHLTNKEYAQEFGRLNNLKGVWISLKHVTMIVLGYIGLIIFGGLTGAGCIMLYQGLSKDDWGLVSLPIVLIAGSISLIMLILSIFSLVKGNKGESLILKQTQIK